MRLKLNSLLLIIGAFILFNPMNVKACSYNELSELKTLASNINISYEEYKKDNNYAFRVFINNLSSRFYLIDTHTGWRFNGTSEGELVLDYFNLGSTTKLDIYSDSCPGTLIYSNYVIIPSLNKFYGNSLCEGIEDYKLCQKWITNTMTYKEFYDDVTKYKESLIIKEEIKKEKNINYLEVFINFIYEYGIIMGLSLLIIFLIVVIIRYIKRDRFKYLE